MNLAAHLNWGTALPVALERAGRVVSSDAVLLAWVGHETVTLPRALRLAAASRSTVLPIWTAIAHRLSYLLALVLFMQGISAFLIYQVLPRLEAIFRDFSLPLPWVTLVTLRGSLGGSVRLPHDLDCRDRGCPFVLSATLPARLGKHAHSTLRSGPGPPAHRACFAFAVAGRRGDQAHRRRSRDARRALSDGVDAPAPGPGSQRSASRCRLDRCAPLPWGDSRVRCRGHQVGRCRRQPVVALAELADTVERRLAARANMLVQTFFPLAVVMLGGVVFVLAVGYFIPLVKLITELANA